MVSYYSWVDMIEEKGSNKESRMLNSMVNKENSAIFNAD